ncbi:MAG: XRE family transcriptional regulator [Proteobacteria bacterium]|nr:MAG: XRE family transcriptional regulator [Pseudomonadota bacterium]
MNLITENFGEMLKRLRKEHGIGYTTLSRAIRFGRKHIADWEAGKILPPCGKVIKSMSKALELSEAESVALAKAAYVYHLDRIQSRYREDWMQVI